MVFGHFGAPGLPWGPPWLPDLAPGPPGPLQTSILVNFDQVFMDFGRNLDRFLLQCFATTRQKKAIIPSSFSRIFGAPAQAEYNDTRAITTTRQKKTIIPSSFSRIFRAPAQAEYNDVRTDLRLEPHLAVLTPLLAISGRVQVANQFGF